ncbi:MAG: hypothetical protein ACD_34C00611G0001 [uncultured bacterium]|nr:MAG: hypothetical protein ACD_34C00611G0001 [uncultured bacterium]
MMTNASGFLSRLSVMAVYANLYRFEHHTPTIPIQYKNAVNSIMLTPETVKLFSL